MAAPSLGLLDAANEITLDAGQFTGMSDNDTDMRLKLGMNPGRLILLQHRGVSP
jgi:hypothetical protein